MIPDRDSCWRAVAANDPRFDGMFYVGVTSTRIYCRPVCRARTPRRDRCRFFASAAAAERAGFRPCLRCRPELAPGNASVDAAHRLARQAVLRITAGALNDGGVDDLARELGVGGRQLRRVVERELGVSPVELAQTCRLLLAKRLLADTALPVTQVALTSGFGSVRRFNTLFRSRYRLSPSALRRTVSMTAPAENGASSPETISLSLSYRPPLAWNALIGFLGGRATPGVERIDGDRYARTIALEGYSGWVRVEHIGKNRTNGTKREAGTPVVRVEVSTSLLPVLMPLLARLRALFDLDAAPADVDDRLGRAGLLERVRQRPGIRVPGAVDGFELAVRAILGQQVTVRGATTLAGRLAERLGTPIATGDPSLNRLAPTAEQVADCSVETLSAIGIPRSRAETIRALARAMADRSLRLEPATDPTRTVCALLELPGIGDWTAEYIAMRALRWPDAFPASDLALRRATGGLTPARLRRESDRWRPWRAYAAMHFWTET